MSSIPCPNCAETFYSETEFREHRTFEMLERGFMKAAEVQVALATSLGFLGSMIRMHLIWQIQKDKGLGLEEAVRLYMTFGDTFNAVYKESQEKP